MTHTHKSVCTHTLLEALMNLDVISAEAELKGGGHGEKWIRQIGPETEACRVTQ